MPNFLEDEILESYEIRFAKIPCINTPIKMATEKVIFEEG